MNIPCKYQRLDREESVREEEAHGLRSSTSGGLFSYLAGRPRYFPIFGTVMIILAVVFISAGRGKSVPLPRTTDPVALAAENMQTLAIALEMFRHDCGRYPATEETLRALMEDPGVPGWRGPYIYNLTRDPWRKPFVYSARMENVSLNSSGPDRTLGTADDIQMTPADTGVVARAIEMRDTAPWTTRTVVLPGGAGKGK
jgi:general secretion pathway protein G